ncbi:MAG: MerR family transcriptional regulator [Actinomycetota bacterium]|nr:MerR family transcriptional regulator [Actinomycetota bacterium]
MRISELSRRSDVPVATVKYYLREGLLHEGLLTSATQASYDDSHVQRLRMVKALTTVGGMSLARIKRVLTAVDDPPESMHDLLGVASGTGDDQEPCGVGAHLSPAHDSVHAMLRRWGWDPADTWCTTHEAVAASLDSLASAGFDLPTPVLDDYREHVMAIATHEVERVPTGSREDAVRYVALGVPLVEPLLLALRRLGHEQVSKQRFEQATSPTTRR